MPIEKWTIDDLAAMQAHESNALKRVQADPFGVWKDWLDTNPVGIVKNIR